MVTSSPEIPPALDDDDDDVSWALQTAHVQWNRGAHADALSWLARAAEAALQVGASDRAAALRQAHAALSQGLWQVTAAGLAVEKLSQPPVSVDVEMESLDDEIESVDDDLESLDDEVEPAEEEAEPAEEEAEPAEEEAEPAEEEAEPAEEEAEAADEEAEPAEAPESEEPPTSPRFPAFEEAHLPSPSLVLGSSEHSPFAPLAKEPGEEPDTEPEGAPHESEPEALDTAGAAHTGGVVELSEGGGVVLEGTALVEVRGLQDLPDDAQHRLALSAKVVALGPDEEVTDFGAALILEGTVYIMPTLVDAACASAAAADVVFSEGSLEPGLPVRVVGAEEGTRVALFAREALKAELLRCPWVEEDLRQIADHYQALAGSAMGSMGERLDDTLRALVTSRCEVQRFGPNEVVLAVGQPVDAMYIVGVGSLAFLKPDGSVLSQAQSGDFVFAEQVMMAGKAPSTVQAGLGGALLLRADRLTAHELMLSVPPLLEILSGA